MESIYIIKIAENVLFSNVPGKWCVNPPITDRVDKQCRQSWAKFSGVPPRTHPLSFFGCSQWQKSSNCKSDIDDIPSLRHLLKDSSMQFFSCSLSHNNTHLISDFSSRFNGSETPITDISDIVEKADTFLTAGNEIYT